MIGLAITLEDQLIQSGMLILIINFKVILNILVITTVTLQSLKKKYRKCCKRRTRTPKVKGYKHVR